MLAKHLRIPRNNSQLCQCPRSSKRLPIEDDAPSLLLSILRTHRPDLLGQPRRPLLLHTNKRLPLLEERRVRDRQVVRLFLVQLCDRGRVVFHLFDGLHHKKDRSDRQRSTERTQRSVGERDRPCGKACRRRPGSTSNSHTTGPSSPATSFLPPPHRYPPQRRPLAPPRRSFVGVRRLCSSCPASWRGCSAAGSTRARREARR